MKKINIKEIIKNYDAILINDWQELRKALDNNKLVMVLDKKDKGKRPGGGNKGGGRKSTEKLLSDFENKMTNKLFNFEDKITNKLFDFENKINNQLLDFKKEIIIAFKSEIIGINNRLDNIVKLNNLKEQ